MGVLEKTAQPGVPADRAARVADVRIKMNEAENGNIIKSGPFKGKRIELASRTGVEMLGEIAEEFMLRIFGFEAGDYLITDESSLHDFTGVGDMELGEIQRKTREAFGLHVSEPSSGNLLEIFIRIHERRSGQS